MQNDRRGLVLLGLMGGLFLAAMDATILAIAMPDVVADLGGAHLYAWGFTSYMLAAAVSMPVLGALADRHGHRRVFLATLGLFILGSVACGLSPGMGAFLAARVAQGVGGGGMLSIPFAMAGALFQGQERGRALGRLSSVWGVAAIAGPLVGAGAVRFLSWEWVFWINIPVGLAGGWLVASLHRETSRASGAGVDLAGALALMGGVAGVLLALEEDVAPRLAFLAGGAALLALFVLRERRAEAPILPVRILALRPVLVANAAATLAALAVFSAIAFVPRYVEASFGEGRAVWSVLPLSVGWSGLAVVMGPRLHRVGVRAPVLVGLATLAAGLAGAPWMMAWGLGGVAVASALMGVGMGLATPALLLAVQNAVPVAEMGRATASQTFLRNVGGAVGIVLLGALIPAGLEETLGGVGRALVAAGAVAAVALVVVLAAGRGLHTRGRSGSGSHEAGQGHS